LTREEVIARELEAFSGLIFQINELGGDLEESSSGRQLQGRYGLKSGDGPHCQESSLESDEDEEVEIAAQ